MKSKGVGFLMCLMVWGASRMASASTETAYDRPVAAAVVRTVGSSLQIWVFACGADNVMRSKTRTWLGSWGGWTTVTTTPCASAPSVALLSGGETEQIGVYFRSTTNRLIEAWYPADGSSPQISDLSNQGGLGNISGTPAVADSDPAGKVAVIVKRAGTNKIYSLDLYSNAWHLHPVMLYSSPESSQAVSVGSVFVVSYNVFDKPYFSARTEEDYQSVFSRTAWTQNYTLKVEVSITQDGLLTFGTGAATGQQGGIGGTNLCTTHGCAIYPRTGSALSVFELHTLQEYPAFNWGSPPGGSAFCPPSVPSKCYGRTSTGALQFYDFTDFVFTGPENTATVDSAPTGLVGAGPAGNFFYMTVFGTLSGGHYQLHLFNWAPTSTEISLGYPGNGVLAP